MTSRLVGLLVAGLAGGLSGCLDAPRLKSCAEFPIGTEGCPSACELWCDEMLAACPSAVPETSSDRRRGCLNTCGEAMRPDGELGALTGDTMACRIEHARLAAVTRQDHCTAASLEGGGICSDARCDVYCEAMATSCPDTFPDSDSCMAACEGFPTASPGQTSAGTDSIECRVAAARAGSCEAAGPSGGGQCGTVCQAYCDQVETHCEGRVYPDRATCETNCGRLRTDETAKISTGERNTVECRLYHATYPAAFDPDTHCPHAGVYHAAHCGPVCVTYCDLMDRHCPSTYADAALCTSDCEERAQAGRPLWPEAGADTVCLP